VVSAKVHKIIKDINMRIQPIWFGLLLSLAFSLNAGAATEGNHKTAIFAGGCFWCMEGPYDALDGVISTTSGYISGHVKNPTYQQVSSGSTGHTEALQVVYDPSKVSYKELLDVFWVNIDPLTADAQFCDHGTQYRSGIFYANEAEKAAAKASLDNVQKKFEKPVVTEITMASTFYPAEKYHQNYYQTNPVRYKYYRWRCGRDARLKELWGDAAPKQH
jgi:peptide-methionine (S)-S-oxide reductase